MPLFFLYIKTFWIEKSDISIAGNNKLIRKYDVMKSEEAKYYNPCKEYHRAAHLVYSCQYHVVFCPKYRRPLLKPPYDEAVKRVFLSAAEELGFSLPAMEVMPDHVHLIVDCSPRLGIDKCIAALKGRSAHMLRTQYPEVKKKLPCVWTRGTFVSTVGSVSLDVVKQYIENQKGA